MTVWGNHSPTQYPDLVNAKVGRERLEGGRRRGLDRRRVHPHGSASAAPRSSRRAARSSAASAANAAIDHVHDWVLGTPDGDWVSMGVPTDGSYGIDEGIISG